MKNLVSKIEKAKKVELKKSLTDLKKYDSVSEFLKFAYYRDKFTKRELKAVELMKIGQFRSELKNKLTTHINKRFDSQINEVLSLESKVLKIIGVRVDVNWCKSATWGANPTAEAWITFINASGYRETEYLKSHSVSGCGYDKESTAVAEALNQSEVLKANLYAYANRPMNKNKTLNEIFGYGSGYGILPRFEGGVGSNCYTSIFAKLKLNFRKTASGKMFDQFRSEVTK